MPEDAETDEMEAVSETEAETDENAEGDVVVDLDSAGTDDDRIEKLQATLEEQREEIEQLRARREAAAQAEAESETEEEVERLQQTVEEQSERIEELEGLVLDLSVRVADDKGMGVCPECHGPVQKTGGFLSKKKIQCRDCGKVYHQY